MIINAETSADDRRRLDSRFFILTLVFFFLTCFIGGLWGTSGSGSIDLYGLRLTGARFVLIYASIWFAALLLFFYYPLNDSGRRSLMLIAGIAVTARMFIFFQAPSDDVFRYLWEGKLIINGISPYIFPPSAPELKELAAAYPFHSAINHPDITAAYPPVVLFFFSLISLFTSSFYSLKAILLGFDIGSIFFLAAILKNRKINLRWTLLYAINPLILYSFAGDGHFDSMQIFFLLAALWCHDTKKWGLLFVFAGLAVQVKYIAIVAVPFLINRDNIKFIPVLILTITLPYIPFMAEKPFSVFDGIRQFENDFAFNGSIFSLLRVLTGGLEIPGILCRLFFVFFWCYCFLKFNNLKKQSRINDPVRGILFAFACLIIFSPTIHFWYLSWILPFAIIRNTTSWIVLSLSAGLYYITKSVAWYGGEWTMPIWAQIIEWSCFYVFFSFEALYAIKRKAGNTTAPPLRSISVIIPVLNEEDKIVTCIRSIQQDPAVSEIIVVDGLSTDKTRLYAEDAGAKVIINKNPMEDGGGRGGQIVQGVTLATGDIVVVVHSDTHINSHIFSEIKHVLNHNPDISGGAAGSLYEIPGSKMKLIEFLNGLRAVFFGISFGDQIQFFRRQEVVDNNLFPNIPLMEDIEFSLRLPSCGRRIFLFSDAKVSSRHWQKGWSDNFFKVIRLFAAYLIQRPFKMPDVAAMYNYYYKRGGTEKNA